MARCDAFWWCTQGQTSVLFYDVPRACFTSLAWSMDQPGLATSPLLPPGEKRNRGSSGYTQIRLRVKAAATSPSLQLCPGEARAGRYLHGRVPPSRSVRLSTRRSRQPAVGTLQRNHKVRVFFGLHPCRPRLCLRREDASIQKHAPVPHAALLQQSPLVELALWKTQSPIAYYS